MNPTNFPIIGKWMLQTNGQIANWKGYILDGKQVQEPINTIFVDHTSLTAEQAHQELINALSSAGYTIQTGHSSGYQADIAGKRFPQFPTQKNAAFSNRLFLLNNNHARIFGPYFQNAAHYFIGAFSHELFRPFTKVKHIYGSFNQARDDVSQKLNARSPFTITQYIPLNNVIINNPKLTTGDHDGIAVVLEKK